MTNEKQTIPLTLDQMILRLADIMDIDEQETKLHLLKYAIATRDYERFNDKYQHHFHEHQSFIYFMEENRIRKKLIQIREAESATLLSEKSIESKQFLKEINMPYNRIRKLVKKDHKGLPRSFYTTLFEKAIYDKQEKAKKEGKLA